MGLGTTGGGSRLGCFEERAMMWNKAAAMLLGLMLVAGTAGRALAGEPEAPKQ